MQTTTNDTLTRRAVGTAIQRGLMVATGYFDDWCTRDDGAARSLPDWTVLEIGKDWTGRPYIDGLNLNVLPGEYGHRFRWYFTSEREMLESPRYRFELCSQFDAEVAA